MRDKEKPQPIGQARKGWEEDVVKRVLETSDVEREVIIAREKKNQDSVSQGGPRWP